MAASCRRVPAVQSGQHSSRSGRKGGAAMTAEIVKFPSSPSRRVHSKKPRRSKNGTPEERAAAAGPLKAPADVVLMSDAREDARLEVDGRKLRSSPLRDYIATVSFGATVVGKMHTAGL